MNDTKSYVCKRWKHILFHSMLFAAFNVYFFFFIQNRQVGYLLYLDLLLSVPAVVFLSVDYVQFQKTRKEKQRFLQQSELICQILENFENKDVAEHDVRILTKQLNCRFQENCDLQDFVAKWCHELKLPLSALLLMDEKISDTKLRRDMREQLEKMNQQLNAMLLGCRLQNPLLDLQIREVFLPECIKTSIRNNQFFLIQKGFELIVEVEPLSVHTDPQWLVYVLDQLINNAIKYGQKEGESGERKNSEREGNKRGNSERKTAERKTIERKTTEEKPPILKFWTEKQKDTVKLHIEDHGQGIEAQDIGRIFEKGYTGKHYHNGKYKSTGLGLYMVRTIIRRMGHQIQVESEVGVFSRFTIVFRENSYFLRH